MDVIDLFDWALAFFLISGGIAILSLSTMGVLFMLNYTGVI